MWNQVTDDVTARKLMDAVRAFHDSCLKEMKYTSGAYVDEDLFMHPTNGTRSLRVILQRQSNENSAIELEFRKLKYLKMFPLDEAYTCEIIDSTLLINNGCYYWCDCGGLTMGGIHTYEGIVICAEKLRWRSIDGFLGNRDYFHEPA